MNLAPKNLADHVVGVLLAQRDPIGANGAVFLHRGVDLHVLDGEVLFRPLLVCCGRQRRRPDGVAQVSGKPVADGGRHAHHAARGGWEEGDADEDDTETARWRDDGGELVFSTIGYVLRQQPEGQGSSRGEAAAARWGLAPRGARTEVMGAGRPGWAVIRPPTRDRRPLYKGALFFSFADCRLSSAVDLSRLRPDLSRPASLALDR